MRGMLLFGLMLVNLNALAAIETEIAFYRPFASTGGAVGKATVAWGECFMQSKRIKRDDALRCISDNRIYDPCFINPSLDEHKALCINSPWSDAQKILQLNQLPDTKAYLSLDASKTYPFAIELFGGEKCVALDGDKKVDNMPIRYQCENQSQLVGHLQRCKAPWSMLKHHQNGNVSEVMIRKVWF